MLITTKVALYENQIEGVNKNFKHFDGCEIQLISHADRLELMDTIELPIRSIHYYLTCYENNGAGKKDPNITKYVSSVYLVINTKEEFSRFVEVAKYAKKYDCPIVLHSTTPFNELDQAKLMTLLNTVRDMDVKLLIENVGVFGHDSLAAYLIPEDCEHANNIIGKKLLRPILDVCHFKIMEHTSSDFGVPIQYHVKDALRKYSSDQPYLHFCNFTTDNAVDSHGQNFAGHIEEMKEYLEIINNENENTTLVLEVWESDYVGRPKTAELYKFIKEAGY